MIQNLYQLPTVFPMLPKNLQVQIFANDKNQALTISNLGVIEFNYTLCVKVAINCLQLIPIEQMNNLLTKLVICLLLLR